MSISTQSPVTCFIGLHVLFQIPFRINLFITVARKLLCSDSRLHILMISLCIIHYNIHVLNNIIEATKDINLFIKPKRFTKYKMLRKKCLITTILLMKTCQLNLDNNCYSELIMNINAYIDSVSNKHVVHGYFNDITKHWKKSSQIKRKWFDQLRNLEVVKRQSDALTMTRKCLLHTWPTGKKTPPFLSIINSYPLTKCCLPTWPKGKNTPQFLSIINCYPLFKCIIHKLYFHYV